MEYNNGSNSKVIGKPVTESSNPIKSLSKVLNDID